MILIIILVVFILFLINLEIAKDVNDTVVKTKWIQYVLYIPPLAIIFLIVMFLLLSWFVFYEKIKDIFNFFKYK